MKISIRRPEVRLKTRNLIKGPELIRDFCFNTSSVLYHPLYLFKARLYGRIFNSDDINNFIFASVLNFIGLELEID